MVARSRYTQKNRRIAISTPLGDDVLLLRGFTAGESISRLFRFDLDLRSEDESLKFEDVVGKNITIRIDLADRGTQRYWNGYISRFSQGRRFANLVSYRAEMVPWLWFLTRTADCRIFQNKAVPDIIRQIFSDLGFQDYKLQLSAKHQSRDYCVQYRETDFNFVARLMEEEGMFYFFEHAKDKHTLIIGDAGTVHTVCPHQHTARYEIASGGGNDEDMISEWDQEQEFRPGKYALTDYNFEDPATTLAVKVAGKSSYEIYDYPGEYRKRGEGDALVRLRLEEEEARRMVARGTSDCRAFTTGYRFELAEHYRPDVNREYVLTDIRHESTQGDNFEPGAAGLGDHEFSYRNTFECIPASVPFRPSRITPRPTVSGCQTAVVVGPGGEEIYTDKYGRVKVQFHWDREGKRNENSSCWVRVSHPWAGKGWGYVSIPRIGQEVIVDFLEGDPDQPIIVGRVYNAGQMPPFGLPGGAVVSGMKSNSTKGGGGFNEISLNDTKGNELINIHAQYDQQKKVEHDERVNVGNDRTKSIGHDENTTVKNNRTEKVGANEEITIGQNRTETVVADETITVQGSRKRTVVGSETVTVKSTRMHTVLLNEMVNVIGAQETNIGALQTLVVGGARLKTVVGKEVVGIGGSQTTGIAGGQRIGIKGDQSKLVGKNQSERVVGNRSAVVLKNDGLKVSKKLTIDAGEQIILTTGKSTITLKSDGTITIGGKCITIDGSDITLKASGKIYGKASGDVIMKGSQVKHN